MTKQYIAGFFDGEGNISITNTDTRKGVIVSMAQKRLPVLYQIQTFLRDKDIEANISVNQAGIGKVYFGAASEVIDFLRMMMPYLIVKKEEALFAIQFLKNRVTRRMKIRMSERARIIKLRAEGMTANEIAIQTGRTLKTIQKLVYV